MYSPHDSEEICKLMDDFKYDRTKTYDVLSKYENNVGIETLNKIYFNKKHISLIKVRIIGR